MPCFHPRTVWRSPRQVHPRTGKPRLLFRKPSKSFFDVTPRVWSPLDPRLVSPAEFFAVEEFQIPGCKSPKCVGCVEDRSRSWAVRAWHESQLHDDNCFITLTFNDEFLPKDGLDHRWFQLFMKRLRKLLSGAAGQAKRVRFFMAGEYGSQFFRPHFHACFFGFSFSDRVLWTVRNDVNLYTSESLSRLWSDPKTGRSYGFSSVGDVTFESAAYIARYCAKKVHGVDAPAHYEGRKPEYMRCSLKPGIGRGWFDKFKNSVIFDDAVTLGDGSTCKLPKYYDRLFELTDAVHHAKVVSMRKRKASVSPDNTPDRLRAREAVKIAQFSQLPRSL